MSNPVLTQWSFLDDQLLAKEVAAALGNTPPLFTTFSFLDPALLQKQIEAKAGHAVFNVRSLYDPGWTTTSLADAIG